MFGFGNVSHKRIKAVEDAICELNDELASIKMQLSSIRGKYAIGQRYKNETQSPYKAMLEKMLGGEVIAVSEKPKLSDADGD